MLEMGKGICMKNTMRICFTSGSFGSAVDRYDVNNNGSGDYDDGDDR